MYYSLSCFDAIAIFVDIFSYNVIMLKPSSFFPIAITFLKEKPEKMEIVLTGRNPDMQLIELADYVSEIKKRKHPFDRGIYARKGIEY